MKLVKLAETWIDPGVRMRECHIGQQCEVLANSLMEYSTLGDFSYLGEYCTVADAQIGERLQQIAWWYAITSPCWREE